MWFLLEVWTKHAGSMKPGGWWMICIHSISVAPQCFIFNGVLWYIWPLSKNCGSCDFDIQYIYYSALLEIIHTERKKSVSEDLSLLIKNAPLRSEKSIVWLKVTALYLFTFHYWFRRNARWFIRAWVRKLTSPCVMQLKLYYTTSPVNTSAQVTSGRFSPATLVV